MELISEELVEETWQETAALKDKQLTKAMKNVGTTQPNLLVFILEFTQDLDQEVKELAVYMLLNLYRMFFKGFKKKIRKISTNEIIECHEHNVKFIGSLEGVHEKFHDRIARTQMSDQPYLMKYMIETLFEISEDEEDPVSLTDDDTGFLFLLFKTVIDILNKTAYSQPGSGSKTVTHLKKSN